MGLFSKLMKKKTRCHKCGRSVYAPRIGSQSTIASSSDHRIWKDDLALKCASCKRITCNTCARKAADAIGEDRPICPSCNGAVG